MNNLFKFSLLSLIISQSFTADAEQVLTDSKLDAIERLTVTATRKEHLDTDLAMSVHGVNKEQLALDNGQHVAESLNSISGVLINQLSGGQGHKTAIRMPMNTSGYYLFLQDNIPLQSAAFFNHNALWWSSFNSNVGRVEVLKGAGTALYGSGAVAATINVISEGITEQPESSLSLTFGEYDYNKVQASHSQKLADNHGIRISGSYLKNDGWRDHTGSKRGEVSLRHEWDLNENETLITSLVISDLEQEMASSLTQELFDNDRTNSGLSAAVLANDPLRKSQYIRLSTQWDKIDGDILYSAIPYIRHRTNDFTATWRQNMPVIESDVSTLGLLALVNFEHGGNSETTVGIDVEFTEGDQLSFQPLDITITGRGADTFTQGEQFYDDTTKYTAASPYIQYRGELTDNLDFTLGARYDYAKYDFDNHLGVYGDIGHGLISLRDRDDSFQHLSPKASLNYHIDDNSSIYTRYANGFRIPTAGSLYHLTTKDSGEAKAVDPEVSDTFEVGYKLNLANLSFDTALYYMDVDDGIVNAYNQQGQRFLTNASRVIHKGVEVAADWQVSEELNINTAYTRSQHKFDKHEDKALEGNELRSAPEYIVNIRVNYKPLAIEGLSAQLEIQSIGEYWLDDANSIDANGVARKDNGYTIGNIKARYQVSKQLSLNARVLNVSDKTYRQEAEFRFGRVSISPGAPRTVYVGMNYQW